MICEEQTPLSQQQQQMNNQVFSQQSYLYSHSQKNNELKPLGYFGQLINQYISLSKQNLNDETCSVQANGYTFDGKHISLKFLISPNKGSFIGFTYEVNIIATKQYPYYPFIVQAEKQIFHPNFDQVTRSLYMEELEFKKWNPSLSLYMLVLKVKWLLIEPMINYIPENSHDCCLMYIYDQEGFRRQLYIQQKSISNQMESEEESYDQQRGEKGPNMKIVENLCKNFRPISCLVNKKKRICRQSYNQSMIFHDIHYEKVKLA